MYYYVTLTLECNLKCKYCYGKCWDESGTVMDETEIDYRIPGEVSYGVRDLHRFIGRDPNPTIVFYGGEPLLRIDLMREIMDDVPARHFILQTNGLLLDKLESDYLNRIDSILVSIDGTERLTDLYRGDGTYSRIIENVRKIRSRGFDGELIARMTVSNDTLELEREVLSLLMRERELFDSLHWQLDALFWKGDFDEERTGRWLRIYSRCVRRLVEIWVRFMANLGRVLRVYPFLGVARSILLNERSRLRCGAGWVMFNIQTDGKITPCPVMAGMKRFYLGDIWGTSPQSLRDSVFVTDPCPTCGIHWICGGRCLYANATKLWGRRGFRMVCLTVRDLVENVRAVAPVIRRLLWEGRVDIEDFNYPRFNSCEIIP